MEGAAQSAREKPQGGLPETRLEREHRAAF